MRCLQYGLQNLLDLAWSLPSFLTSCATMSKHFTLLNHSFLPCKMEMMMMMVTAMMQDFCAVIEIIGLKCLA